MKKFTIILVILCLAASVIPAWAEPETDWAEGRWRLYNIGVNEGDATSFHAPEEFGVEREIYLLPDGTGLFYIKDNEKGGFAPFQWRQDASSPNVLQTNFGELTYVATVQELQLNSDDGVERFFYRKVDWPVQIPAKKKAEKIEDYYGMWKLRAADGSSLGFNGLFDANALGNIYQAYFFVNKNGVSLYQSGSVFGDEKKLNYSTFSDARVKDGSLQIKMETKQGGEQYVDFDTFENGWVFFPLPYGNFYFEKAEEDADNTGVTVDESAAQGGASHSAPEPTAAPAAASGRKVRVNEGSNPNVRSKPGADGQKVGTAKSGKTYDLLDERDGWYKIRLEDGTEGWIADGMAKVVSK